MARHRKTFRLVAALVPMLVGALPARAYEEQASLDTALGYALVLDSPGLPKQGPSIDLGAALGISDIAVVRGLLGYAAFVDGERVSHAGRLRVEALYLIDVLRFVPFFGLGAQLLLAEYRGPNVAAADASSLLLRPGGQLVFGADYLLSRSWTLGVDVRAGVLLEHGELRSTTDVALRVSRMFEIF